MLGLRHKEGQSYLWWVAFLQATRQAWHLLHLVHVFSELWANGHLLGDKDQGPHSQQGSFPILATTSLQIPDLCRAF